MTTKQRKILYKGSTFVGNSWTLESMEAALKEEQEMWIAIKNNDVMTEEEHNQFLAEEGAKWEEQMQDFLRPNEDEHFCKEIEDMKITNKYIENCYNINKQF
jgi:hypothetical protein